MLAGAEMRYLVEEKLALAVVTAARKLRPYFQSHRIAVMTIQPFRTILHNPSKSGRLVKWSIKLSEYDIEYRIRTNIKSQVKADFVVELARNENDNLEQNNEWSLYVDGASSKQGAAIGIHLVSPMEEILEPSFRLCFDASNNVINYEALIVGLRLAIGLVIKQVVIHTDSQLISSEVNGDYEAKDQRMVAYMKLTKEIVGCFDKFRLF